MTSSHQIKAAHPTRCPDTAVRSSEYRSTRIQGKARVLPHLVLSARLDLGTRRRWRPVSPFPYSLSVHCISYRTDRVAPVYTVPPDRRCRAKSPTTRTGPPRSYRTRGNKGRGTRLPAARRRLLTARHPACAVSSYSAGATQLRAADYDDTGPPSASQSASYLASVPSEYR